MRQKTVLGAAAVVTAAALIGGSVQATGALWRDQEQVSNISVSTGFLALTPGARVAGAYEFGALAKSPVALGQRVSAALVITNAGTAPLRFRLESVALSVATVGASVQVDLAGDIMGPSATCGTAGAGTAFTATTPAVPTVAGPTVVNSGWRSLAKGASESWCIRTTLNSVSGTQPATYKHLFKFGAEST